MDLQTEMAASLRLMRDLSPLPIDSDALLQSVARRYLALGLGPLPLPPESGSYGLLDPEGLVLPLRGGLGGGLSLSGLNAALVAFSLEAAFLSLESDSRRSEFPPGSRRARPNGAPQGFLERVASVSSAPVDHTESDGELSEDSSTELNVPTSGSNIKEASTGWVEGVRPLSGFSLVPRAAASSVHPSAVQNSEDGDKAGVVGLNVPGDGLEASEGAPVLATSTLLSLGSDKAALASLPDSSPRGTSVAASHQGLLAPAKKLDHFLQVMADWAQLENAMRASERIRRQATDMFWWAELPILARQAGRRARTSGGWLIPPSYEGGSGSANDADPLTVSQLKFFGRRVPRVAKQDPRDKRKKKGRQDPDQDQDSADQ